MRNGYCHIEIRAPGHMTVTGDQVDAGQAVYSKRVLTAYDVIVLGISNRFIWKCPTQELLAHYNRHVSANHLDVGVGSGYFLDRCRFPVPDPRLALMDLNQNSLAYAAERAARYEPKTYQRNVLQTIKFRDDKFDSVGVNYLLHCVPGNIVSKAVIFDHLVELMKPDGVLFGSTLLQGGVSRNWFARRLMAFYNKKGIFSNTQDNLDDLERALRQRFNDVTIEVVGCGALFMGRLAP